MIAFALLAAVQAAPPSTADLAFMIGSWRLEGAFNPDAATARTEQGTQVCAFVMGGAYVRCDWSLRSPDGRARELVSYHNYNPLYRRYENLYIASNWPTKVIGPSEIDRSNGRIVVRGLLSFTLPDGRTEHLRSTVTYAGDRFENVEQIRLSGEAENAWRTNYAVNGVRTAPQ